MAEGRGVYLLSQSHRDDLQRFATDRAVAAMLDVADLSSASGVDHYITRQRQERAEGSDYVFVVLDGGQGLGLCSLRGIVGGKTPQLEIWIAEEHRGKGHATFAAKIVLEFAFQNLQLERVRSAAADSSDACRRVLEKQGFQAAVMASSDGALYEITREQWQDVRNRPALALLNPLLRTMLETELAAGNEVAEVSQDWPDPDSVFVRLRQPFRTRHEPLPDGIVYSEPNDPHWWTADYSSQGPRHMLAY